MPFQGEGPGPRGFAREGVLPTSDTDAPAAHLLALAEPAASLVTLYPPTLEELAGSREATLLYMHQLITAAKLEEQQHASYQRCSGIRNLRLLEHQVHHDLFRAELSAPETKAAVVQTELTCERLFRNLVELIETHDKFWVATFLEGEANLGETALFDGLYVTELAQALAVGEAVVDETLDRVTAAASRDQAVVNPQLREQLVALQGVCPRLDVPRLAVVMALDFPEIVSPFPGGEPPAPGPETPFSVVDEPTGRRGDHRCDGSLHADRGGLRPIHCATGTRSLSGRRARGDRGGPGREALHSAGRGDTRTRDVARVSGAVA